MANVRFHPEALDEYRAALLWYGRRSRRAAEGFERAIDRIQATLSSTPDAYPFHDDRHREAVLTRYPYSVVYRIEPNGDVTVIAVAAAAREPGYWRGRT
jgi:plasmid stabilization system protein ParE